MHIMTTKRRKPTRTNIIGKRYGKVVVLGRSDKRASRGKRTIPLWECLCDCGNITYKATDSLTNASISMCRECAQRYSAEKMRENVGLIGGTQISRIKSDKLIASNTSGARGVYYSEKSGKWRARLRFKGKTYNLGTYKNFEDAVKARKDGEERIYGEFLANTKQI